MTGTMGATIQQYVKYGAKHNGPEILVYFAFAIIATAVAQAASDMVFSGLITLSAAFLLLGFTMLLVEVSKNFERSAKCISLSSLYLFAAALSCRLYSTTQYNGYLPVDRTGQWVYQCVEASSLVCVLVLIALVRYGQKKYGVSPEEENAVFFLLIVCFLAAIFVHPYLNNKTVPDVLWAMALYVETVAMLPQLYLLSNQGEVGSLQSHFIASTFVSRVIIFRFWLTCYKELKPKASYLNLPGWGVMGSQLFQLVMVADFMWLYVKSFRDNSSKIVIPKPRDVHV
jgi:hypothetical protein